MADYKEYDHTQYSSGGIYPLQNPIKRGYGVKDPDVNPATKQSNGRFVNQKNEKIDFWIEEIETGFGITGSKAQSRNVRQFMPHNVVQPTITVTGRAPNSFQYNRLSSFVRASHWNAFHPGVLGDALRHEITGSGQVVQVQTVRLIIRNGEYAWNGSPRGNEQRRDGEEGSGRNVKGVHVPWALEGYVKAIKAGAERFNQAPQFTFEFAVAESQFKQGNINIGMWEDVRVYGSELKPWLDWIKKGGGFVTVTEKEASTNTLDAKEKNNNNQDNLPAPGSILDVPNLPGELTENGPFR